MSLELFLGNEPAARSATKAWALRESSSVTSNSSEMSNTSDMHAIEAEHHRRSVISHLHILQTERWRGREGLEVGIPDPAR